MIFIFYPHSYIRSFHRSTCLLKIYFKIDDQFKILFPSFVTGSFVSKELHPWLAILSPFLVIIRYSVPGTVAASFMLSDGVITLNAVANAPASVALDAITVALIILSAG